MKASSAGVGNNKGGKPRPAAGNRGVLSDLRQGWLADNETGSTNKAATHGAGVDGTLGIVWEEFVRLLAGLRRFPGALVAAAKRSCEGMGERAAEAATGTPGMLALLGLVVVIGALLYAMTVQHIFDRGALPDMPRTDVPVAVRGSSSEQAAAAASPEQGGEQANNALYEAALRGFEWAVGKGGTGALPSPEALASAADWYGRSSAYVPVPRAYDYGNVFDWVDFRTTQKAGSEQVQGKDLTTLQIVGAGAKAGSAGRRGTNGFAVQRASAAPQASVFRAEQRVAIQELRAVVSRPATVPVDRSLPALELAQMTAASGGEGDVERTALAVIAHGGDAVFEVQHFDAATGVWHPARIVVTATALGFLPEGQCEAGAFTIPLASVSSVQAGQSDPQRFDADLLNIEITERGAVGRLSLREPLSNAAEPSAVPESEMLTHIRNVIVMAQRHS